MWVYFKTNVDEITEVMKSELEKKIQETNDELTVSTIFLRLHMSLTWKVHNKNILIFLIIVCVYIVLLITAARLNKNCSN